MAASPRDFSALSARKGAHAVPLLALTGWRGDSVCGSRFNLPSYYTVIKPIGQGAYGIGKNSQKCPSLVTLYSEN